MTTRFIDNYEVIVLDMGNTFMFGCDNFSEEEDYSIAYKSLGGGELSREELSQHINWLHKLLLQEYRNPENVEFFKRVGEYIREFDEFSELSDLSLEMLEDVYAFQECGRIPETHANVLKELRKTHPLGLISNILSKKKVFEFEFKRAGVLELFEQRIWSSDYGCIKPSSRLFQAALDYYKIAPDKILYVGDNADRDVVGAKSLGMGAVWIENERRPLSDEHPQPNLIISDLSDLLA